MTNKYDVFLSHSALDNALAADVQLLLESNHISVFSTPQSIRSGRWEPRIEAGLQDARQIWVILTPNALGRSVWVHHELGYFYGFRHGREEDELGDNSRYVYEEGTDLPGLYAHLQGTKVESVWDPEQIARTIAEALGKTLEVPKNWVPAAHEPVDDADDDEHYQEQLARLFMAPDSEEHKLLADVRAVGHWEIIIRPREFLSRRIESYPSLYGLVATNRYGLVYGDYPFLNSESKLFRESDWVGQADRDYNQGALWGLYQSGQFVYISTYPTDGDEGVFPVVPAVYDLTGFFAFARNLLGEICDGGEDSVIQIVASGLAGRTLEAPKQRLMNKVAQIDRFDHTVTVSMDELTNGFFEAAERVLVDLFEKFGWNDSSRAVREIQKEFSRVMPR